MAAKALTGEEYSKALIRAAQTGTVPGGLTREDAANIRATISNPSTRNQILQNVKTATPPKQETTLKRSPAPQKSSAPVNKNPAPKTEGVNDKPSSLPKPSDQKQPQLELNSNTVNRDSRVRTTGQSISQKFDINSFRSEMLFNDVLPSHSYLVTFAPFRLGFRENIPLTNFVSEKRNTLMMRCENVVLPSPSLLEEENIRRYGYGPVEKIPYGVQFSDVTMTWVVDKHSELIDFFHQWMNTIVMHDSENASIGPSVVRPQLDNYRPFEVGYKDGYANPIVRIYVYDRQLNTVTEYEMYDVFPMNIQSMNLAWADENEVQKLTVTFAYTNMRMRAPQKSNKQFNVYDSLNKTGISPYQHFDFEDWLKTVPDTPPAPANESIQKTVNASKPNATESKQTAPTNVVVPPNSPTRRTLNP